LLGQIEDAETIVLADFEAGLGTLSRLKPGQLDVALVIAEPTAKSLEVARRAVELLRERGVGRTVVVANRMAGQPDEVLMASSLADTGFIVVPDDPAIRAADAGGLAPYDTSPEAPAVRALHALAVSLLA
jgi:CO dehydrogenase maturation factor